MKRALLMAVALVLIGCSQKQSASTEPIPAAPNYADSTQWYIVDREGGADLFYIISTETVDHLVDGDTCHYADTRDEAIREAMLSEMVGVDKLLSGGLNYFSPYYRQCSLESFSNEDTMTRRLTLALGDVREAFGHYIKYRNNGRPFILAGFSQGAIALIDLLKEMDDETYSRLVAAYVIGWKVSDGDLSSTSHIVPARDSGDVGVTVCYNSVRDNGCAIPLLSDGNRVAINPVNWRCDGAPALLIDPRNGDTLTVALDTASLLLHVGGYSRDDYMLPLIGREGNYHRLEMSLYSDCLRRNMDYRSRKL